MKFTVVDSMTLIFLSNATHINSVRADSIVHIHCIDINFNVWCADEINMDVGSLILIFLSNAIHINSIRANSNVYIHFIDINCNIWCGDEIDTGVGSLILIYILMPYISIWKNCFMICNDEDPSLPCGTISALTGSSSESPSSCSLSSVSLLHSGQLRMHDVDVLFNMVSNYVHNLLVLWVIVVGGMGVLRVAASSIQSRASLL